MYSELAMSYMDLTNTDGMYRLTTEWEPISTGTAFSTIDNTIRTYHDSVTPVNFQKGLGLKPAPDLIEIERFDILSSKKVIKVQFTDGTSVKAICHDGDVFSLNRGLFIAMAKRLYGDEYTVEGVEFMAAQLSYLKKYNKMVDKAIKLYEKEIKEKAKELETAQAKETVRTNKKRKHDMYLKRRDEKRRQAKIEELAEAIRKANK